MHTEEIVYQDNGVSCRGFIAYNPETTQPAPCVLVAHDWSGRSKAACQVARLLAEMGYVGFAIDMYGDARIGETTEDKTALMNSIASNRKKLSQRINLALQTAQSHSRVNPLKVAAIGFCFGGLCVLDLARSGAEVKGVISFHGILNEPSDKECNKITAKVLALQGYDDPLSPPKEIQAFEKEMTAKNVDWQIHLYGKVMHAFTNPNAHEPELGLQYNAVAEKRSWGAAKNFLNELFS
jgi:dienelactone hydrolase